MKNNHSIRKATILFCAFFGLAVGSLSAIFSSQDSGRALRSPLRKSEQEVAIDPTEYEEASSASLTPKITTYTGTSLSRHLNVLFESKALVAYAPSPKTVFYVVDDARFTGDNRNPFNEDVPDKTLNGFTYHAENVGSGTSIYICNSISYGSRFTIRNTKVVSHAMYQTKEYDSSLGHDVVKFDCYKNLQTIYICDGVTEIESGAFVDVPDTVTFKCLAASKPADWADDWTDADPAQIEWGAELDSASKATTKHTGSTTTFGDAEDYILGYKGNSDIGFGSYPLTISYRKTKVNGEVETVYQTIPTKHQTNPYDAVGSKIYGNTNSFEVTINVEKGEEIDETSYEFYNIFKAQRYYIEEKVSWPVDKINDVLDFYNVPTKIEGEETGFIPSIEGDNYFYQEFETDNDKYLTIAREFDTEEAANQVMGKFIDGIEAISVSKDVYQTEDDLSYAHIPEYNEEQYGKVYNLFLKYGEIRTNIFLQSYVQLNPSISKYEFVVYLVLDNPVDELDEEGNPTGKLINSRSPLPITTKSNAIRPFLYVPEYVENGSEKLPKAKLKSLAVARYGEMIAVDNLLLTSYNSSSKFMNYTSIGMLVDKVLITGYAGYILDENGKYEETDKLYSFLKENGKYYNGTTEYNEDDLAIVGSFQAPKLYLADNANVSKVETNLAGLVNGTVAFRYTLSNLNSATLVVSYKDGNEVKTTEIPVRSPSPVIELDKETGNNVSFIVNGSSVGNIAASDIVALGISGVTVNIHLYNSETHAVVQNTQYLNIFGNIEVLPYSESGLTYFDIDLYLILFYVILTVGYAVAAVGLFLYKKNRFKNDEFRRVKPKAFIKSSLLGYLGLVLVTAAVNFVVLRFAVFSSTVPAYNPIDAFVIGFVIAGAIAFGLFIRSFIVTIKLIKHRHEVLRLKLDKDVAEDGTN